MGGFTVGLVAGCLLGVCGTFFLLTVSAAFSSDGARIFRVRSVLGTILSSLVLLCITALCEKMRIGKDAAVLMLLFAVLAISKLEGLLNGLIATAMAAMILAWVLPPSGSLMIRSSSDRLALALFLLLATLGSRMIGSRERSAL